MKQHEELTCRRRGQDKLHHWKVTRWLPQSELEGVPFPKAGRSLPFLVELGTVSWPVVRMKDAGGWGWGAPGLVDDKRCIVAALRVTGTLKRGQNQILHLWRDFLRVRMEFEPRK